MQWTKPRQLQTVITTAALIAFSGSLWGCDPNCANLSQSKCKAKRGCSTVSGQDKKGEWKYAGCTGAELGGSAITCAVPEEDAGGVSTVHFHGDSRRMGSGSMRSCSLPGVVWSGAIMIPARRAWMSRPDGCPCPKGLSIIQKNRKTPDRGSIFRPMPGPRGWPLASIMDKTVEEA